MLDECWCDCSGESTCGGLSGCGEQGGSCIDVLNQWIPTKSCSYNDRAPDDVRVTKCVGRGQHTLLHQFWSRILVSATDAFFYLAKCEYLFVILNNKSVEAILHYWHLFSPIPFMKFGTRGTTIKTPGTSNSRIAAQWQILWTFHTPRGGGKLRWVRSL